MLNGIELNMNAQKVIHSVRFNLPILQFEAMAVEAVQQYQLKVQSNGFQKA
jgi:hypothetical protein